MPDAAPSTYREVRGLTRGLAVLRALNAMPGGIGGVSELAHATGLHRTTVKRLLETLKAETLVLQKDDGASYALGFGVRRLSEGYVGADWIDRIAWPAMQAHQRVLSWPSDVVTPDSGFMIVRESTHRVSLLSQHRAMIGVRLPMLVSAAGRAWLAACSPEERKASLALLRERADSMGVLARDDAYVKRVLRETRRRGYAVSKGEWELHPKMTSIAFPIVANGQAIGAINLIMPHGAVSDREIATRYAPLLHTLAEEISQGASGRPWSWWADLRHAKNHAVKKVYG
jgi:IclR family mhp operon transcriptional activator